MILNEITFHQAIGGTRKKHSLTKGSGKRKKHSSLKLQSEVAFLDTLQDLVTTEYLFPSIYSFSRDPTKTSTMATPDRKIIDLLNEKKEQGVKTCISLEYFPPRTEEGVKVCHFSAFFLEKSGRLTMCLL